MQAFVRTEKTEGERKMERRRRAGKGHDEFFLGRGESEREKGREGALSLPLAPEFGLWSRVESLKTRVRFDFE